MEEVKSKVSQYEETKIIEEDMVMHDEDANQLLKNTSKKAFYRDLKSVIE